MLVIFDFFRMGEFKENESFTAWNKLVRSKKYLNEEQYFERDKDSAFNLSWWRQKMLSVSSLVRKMAMSKFLFDCGKVLWWEKRPFKCLFAISHGLHNDLNDVWGDLVNFEYKCLRGLKSQLTHSFMKFKKSCMNDELEGDQGDQSRILCPFW